MTDISGVVGDADIRAGRLTAEQYAANFDDLVAPLDAREAVVEANRCHFCYDAPCVEACPTGIDIPGFIRGIATGNVRGAGVRILEENIFGGSCARVCPTEILCQQACVRNTAEEQPVRIGSLQRYATDPLLDAGRQPFERAPASGKTVGVVGAGPAGLACAHRLALLGHDVTVYEAKAVGGGLNSFGIAEYKLPHGFAGRELDFILSIGGITVKTGVALGRDISLGELRQRHDAVFLGMGLSGVKALEAEGENLAGVANAVDFIAELRQAGDFAQVAIGARVVVVGGGNTAIDAAIQSRRLGARDVTLVYRRGPTEMGATHHEQELAQVNGVKIVHWVKPVRLNGPGGRLASITLERTRLDGGRLVGTGETYDLAADQVFKAIGQSFVPDPLRDGGREALDLSGAKIAVDENGKTSLPRVWAGGDCVPGQDLTVEAVQDGKLAAIAIDRALRA